MSRLTVLLEAHPEVEAAFLKWLDDNAPEIVTKSEQECWFEGYCARADEVPK
jgi:hypothetical protein